MMNLPIPEKPEYSPPPPPPPPLPQTPHDQLSETEYASSSASSDGEEEEEKGVFYGLRENPKRSIRLVDPEFSFAVDAGSVVLQDRESETESSKNPTRRRSKRTRNLDQKFFLHHHHQHQQHHQQQQQLKVQEQEEPEPVSSISDTTTEEDVAFCLMMLSRDQWKKKQEQDYAAEEEEEEDEAERSMEDSEESEEHLLKLSKPRSRGGGKYKCETCNKTFRSYQALGGHRASHKKIKLVNSGRPIYEPEFEQEKKIHECPVCFRVFASGQALGGHKRTHVTGSTHRPPSVKISAKLGEALIDLNLPAPMDDDDISQIELSAVSDAEFVNPIRQ